MGDMPIIGWLFSALLLFMFLYFVVRTAINDSSMSKELREIKKLLLEIKLSNQPPVIETTSSAPIEEQLTEECPSCGKKVRNSEKICPNCGLTLSNR